MSREALEEAIRRLPACQSYAVAAFASVSAYRGSVGLAGELPHAVEALVASGKPVALVALGNPYLLRRFPRTWPRTWRPSATCRRRRWRRSKALFGEIDIRGHLPVSIPGLANYGEGIQVPATRAVAGCQPGAVVALYL